MFAQSWSCAEKVRSTVVFFFVFIFSFFIYPTRYTEYTRNLSGFLPESDCPLLLLSSVREKREIALSSVCISAPRSYVFPQQLLLRFPPRTEKARTRHGRSFLGFARDAISPYGKTRRRWLKFAVRTPLAYRSDVSRSHGFPYGDSP